MVRLTLADGGFCGRDPGRIDRPLYDGGGIDLEVSLLTRHFAGRQAQTRLG